MKDYFFENNGFVINDYLNKKRFSSFLPSIAGINGCPLWAFYANVGQCIGGFGVDSKDTPIAPFDSAYLAYQNIPFRGFNTALKINGKVYRPFTLNNHAKQKMIVYRDSITIEEEHELYKIRVRYSTLSNLPCAGLLRYVDIESEVEGKQEFQIIDGLALMLPYGLSNYCFNMLSTLMSSYCEADLNSGAPYLTFKGGEDSSIVKKSVKGNAYFAISSSGKLLEPIVDPDCVYESDIISSITFDKLTNKQVLEGKIHSGFVTDSFMLSKGETYSFVSLYGSFSSKEEFNNYKSAFDYDFLVKQKEVTKEVVESVITSYPVTNDPLFDEFIKQSIFDNALRGGYPVTVKNKVQYIYSRKHGDMERDYNDFSIPSKPMSAGPGNFRDVNQNRRNDLYLNPKLFDQNLVQFFSLIQLDGFNPLIVHNDGAETREGYWIDHWTYNTDLLENFLSIYPDKWEEVLHSKKCTYFNSDIFVQPRSEKYVIVNNNVRQYHSTKKLQKKSSTLLDKYEEPVHVSLSSKIINLILIKSLSLDAHQLGIEMEADKPGWNDALNGLPGLFGSSLCETIELLRLVKFYRNNINFDVEFLVEQYDLFSKAKKLFDKFQSKTISQFEFWDESNNLKEEFRLQTFASVDGETVVVKSQQISEFLIMLESVLDSSIKSVKKLSNVIPTYFINEVSKYHLKNKKVVVDEFVSKPLCEFLEGTTHLGKLGKEYFKDEDYEEVKKTDIFDKKLHLYKTCGSIEHESNELGRIRSFSPGWLERECAFLHMSYKYLVSLFNAEQYETFFKESKQILTYKMDPAVYGRNPLEASSFIAPSCNHDESKHGQGFFARLTGANAEVVDLFYKVFIGNKLFSYENGKLSFAIKPHIPASLFDKHNSLKIVLFNNKVINFVNRNHRNYNDQQAISYMIGGCEYERVPEEYALNFRNGKLKEITVVIK